MTRSKTSRLLAVTTMLISLCVAPASWARGPEDCIRYGSEKEGMRCFDCIRRVWTGHGWQLQNTCQPRAPYNFFSR